MAAEGAHFTGGPAEERGPSLVQRHQQLLRDEEERGLVDALQARLPAVPSELCRISLESCAWDPASAEEALLAFAAEQARTTPAAGGRDSDSERRRKRRKHGKEERHEKKRRKEDRREPGAGEEGKGTAATATYGRYGIVRPEDMWTKAPEFNAWLQEVKSRNPEAIAKWEEKELFREYAEDFNTSTLPCEKFYDLDRWHRQQAAAADGGAEEEAPDFRRMEDDRRRELEAQRARSKEASHAATLEHMRVMGKLDGLREQQSIQAQLQLAAQVGDMERVRDLQAKLRPDDPRKGAGGDGMGYGFRPT